MLTYFLYGHNQFLVVNRTYGTKKKSPKCKLKCHFETMIFTFWTTYFKTFILKLVLESSLKRWRFFSDDKINQILHIDFPPFSFSIYGVFLGVFYKDLDFLLTFEKFCTFFTSYLSYLILLSPIVQFTKILMMLLALAFVFSKIKILFTRKKKYVWRRKKKLFLMSALRSVFELSSWRLNVYYELTLVHKTPVLYYTTHLRREMMLISQLKQSSISFIHTSSYVLSLLLSLNSFFFVSRTNII